MAAPPKPWEMAGTSSRMDNGEIPQHSSFAPGIGTQVLPPSIGMPLNAPPSLPPRPYASQAGYGSSAAMPYGGYGNTFGSYGTGYNRGYGMGGYGSSYGGFGGYGGYGAQSYGNQGYGNFCGGLNRFNGNMFGDVESRFIQMAEESSRPTFQSIESVVGAVGSVAMMLENTFFAMTSSFRAILGVAENFGRLRSLFAQFWSAFAIFRAFNWLIKKLLVLLGIRTEEEFRAWAEATRQTQSETNPSTGSAPRTSSWPAILFLAVIGAVPYIIVKMLSSINSTIQNNASDPTTWQNPMQALAQYDFQASSPQELSFRAHQIITIAPQNLQGNLWNSGWLLASSDNKTSGLVPVNYFKIIKNSANLPQQTGLPALKNTDQNCLPNASPMENVHGVCNNVGEQTVTNPEIENNLQNVVMGAEPAIKEVEKCLDESRSNVE